MSKAETKFQTLSRKLRNTLSSDISRYKKAYDQASSLGFERFMASGVIISAVSLDGREVLGEVMLLDGLSKETIAAIKNDIKRSQDLRLSLNVISSSGAK